MVTTRRESTSSNPRRDPGALSEVHTPNAISEIGFPFQNLSFVDRGNERFSDSDSDQDVVFVFEESNTDSVELGDLSNMRKRLEEKGAAAAAAGGGEEAVLSDSSDDALERADTGEWIVL